MKRILGLIQCIVLWGVVVVSPALAGSSVPQVFLIQNSGWMLPFYEAPDSKLKDLVIELSERIRQYGGTQQFVASFNQTYSDNVSPKLHYQGGDQDKINEAIRSIAPARKPGRSAYTDTDFKEAIVGAIKNFSPGKPCLLWIVTNNKNSPDNSLETVRKNKEFYQFLQDSAEIKRIVAFPYAMKVQSRSRSEYSANGLMIYAMAYGDEADQHLQKMLAAGAPFGKQPARLKPLNAEALTFVPKSVKGNDNVEASLPDQKTLVLRFNASSRPESAQIIGQFRNNFYPYDIRSAVVGIVAGFQGGKEGIVSQLSNDKVERIPAGGFSSDIIVSISVPSIPSLWSPNIIFGSGYQKNGMIQFKLSDQQLEISKEFVKSMAELFPNDPLPELFVPGNTSQSSVTNQPLAIQVVYPSWPLLLFGGLVLLIAGVAITGIVFMRREVVYRVSVDGVQKPYGLRPFNSIMLKNSNGERVGLLKRRWGKPIPILDKGKNCSLRVL